jgi:DNA polymerase-3 subunit beta
VRHYLHIYFELNEIFKLPPSTSVAVTSSFTVPISGDVDDNSEGGNLKISFNSKYMMDALKAIDNDEVEVEFFGTLLMRPSYILS